MNLNYNKPSRLFTLVKAISLIMCFCLWAVNAIAQDIDSDTSSLIKTGTTFNGNEITGVYTRTMRGNCANESIGWCWVPKINGTYIKPDRDETYLLDPSGDVSKSATRYSHYEYGGNVFYRAFHYAFNPLRPRFDGQPTLPVDGLVVVQPSAAYSLASR